VGSRKWTKDRPTRDGYYWARLNPGGFVEVVKVCQSHDGSWEYSSPSEDGMWGIDSTCAVTEWAGPIPTPEEADAW
jgi:hypothetical protein